MLTDMGIVADVVVTEFGENRGGVAVDGGASNSSSVLVGVASPRAAARDAAAAVGGGQEHQGISGFH